MRFLIFLKRYTESIKVHAEFFWLIMFTYSSYWTHVQVWSICISTNTETLTDLKILHHFRSLPGIVSEPDAKVLNLKGLLLNNLLNTDNLASGLLELAELTKFFFPFWISCCKAEILFWSSKWSVRGRSRSTRSLAASCQRRKSQRLLFTGWGSLLLIRLSPSHVSGTSFVSSFFISL